VPDQISILGFDDNLWNRYFSPSLTAVAQSSFEMGQRACELLLHHINTHEETHRVPARICLATELRIRNSTAPPPVHLTSHPLTTPPPTPARLRH
jgi:LacI family transcriptional regulator